MLPATGAACLPAPLATLVLPAPALGAGSHPLLRLTLLLLQLMLVHCRERPVCLPMCVCAMLLPQTPPVGPGKGGRPRHMLPITPATSPGPALLPPVSSASPVPTLVLDWSLGGPGMAQHHCWDGHCPASISSVLGCAHHLSAWAPVPRWGLCRALLQQLPNLGSPGRAAMAVPPSLQPLGSATDPLVG